MSGRWLARRLVHTCVHVVEDVSDAEAHACFAFLVACQMDLKREGGGGSRS